VFVSKGEGAVSYIGCRADGLCAFRGAFGAGGAFVRDRKGGFVYDGVVKNAPLSPWIKLLSYVLLCPLWMFCWLVFFMLLSDFATAQGMPFKMGLTIQLFIFVLPFVLVNLGLVSGTLRRGNVLRRLRRRQYSLKRVVLWLILGLLGGLMLALLDMLGLARGWGEDVALAISLLWLLLVYLLSGKLMRRCFPLAD